MRTYKTKINIFEFTQTWYFYVLFTYNGIWSECKHPRTTLHESSISIYSKVVNNEDTLYIQLEHKNRKIKYTMLCMYPFSSLFRLCCSIDIQIGQGHILISISYKRQICGNFT